MPIPIIPGGPGVAAGLHSPGDYTDVTPLGLPGQLYGSFGGGGGGHTPGAVTDVTPLALPGQIYGDFVRVRGTVRVGARTTISITRPRWQVMRPHT